MNILDRYRADAAIPQLEKQIRDISDGIIDRVYPIGAYFYTSDAKFDPNASWGGAWTMTSSSPYTWHRTR